MGTLAANLVGNIGLELGLVELVEPADVDFVWNDSLRVGIGSTIRDLFDFAVFLKLGGLDQVLCEFFVPSE